MGCRPPETGTSQPPGRCDPLIPASSPPALSPHATTTTTKNRGTYGLGEISLPSSLKAVGHRGPARNPERSALLRQGSQGRPNNQRTSTLLAPPRSLVHSPRRRPSSSPARTRTRTPMFRARNRARSRLFLRPRRSTILSPRRHADPSLSPSLQAPGGEAAQKRSGAEFGAPMHRKMSRCAATPPRLGLPPPHRPVMMKIIWLCTHADAGGRNPAGWLKLLAIVTRSEGPQPLACCRPAHHPRPRPYLPAPR